MEKNKKFEEPELEVTKISIEDVITTSIPLEDDDENGLGWG